MAERQTTVSVRIEIANYDEILRLYHALGDLLAAGQSLRSGESGTDPEGL